MISDLPINILNTELASIRPLSLANGLVQYPPPNPLKKKQLVHNKLQPSGRRKTVGKQAEKQLSDPRYKSTLKAWDNVPPMPHDEPLLGFKPNASLGLGQNHRKGRGPRRLGVVAGGGGLGDHSQAPTMGPSRNACNALKRPEEHHQQGPENSKTPQDALRHPESQRDALNQEWCLSVACMSSK